MPLQMPYQFRPYPLSPDEDPEDPNQVQIPNQPPPQAPLPPPPQIQPSPPQPPPPEIAISRTPGPPPGDTGQAGRVLTAGPVQMPNGIPGYPGPGAQPLPNLPYSEDRATQAVQEAPPNLPGPPTGMRPQLPPGIQGPGAGIPPPQVAPPQMSPEMQQYQTIMGQMPQRPKPSWLDRIVAMAAGGAQGYLAGSPARATREAAAQFQGIPQQILEGDYPERMREWQTRMGAAAQAAGMSQKAQDAMEMSRLRQAQAGWYEGRNPTQEAIAQGKETGLNQRAASKAQSRMDELHAKQQADLLPVSPDGTLAKMLDKLGLKPMGLTPDEGYPQYSKSAIAAAAKSMDHEGYQKFKMALQRDALASKWDLAEMTQGEITARADADRAARERISARNQASRKSATAEDRQEAARIRADNTYQRTDERINKDMLTQKAQLDRQFGIGTTMGAQTPEKLPPAQQVRYWQAVIEIEKNSRHAKQGAASAHARAYGKSGPDLEPMWEGEAYARKRLEALGAKVPPPEEGTQSQESQPSGETKLQGLMGGQAYIGKPAPTNRKFPAGISWDPATGWYVQAGSGAQYGWDGEKLVKVAGGTGARPSGR